ncbi:hypothetical protein [uncultured Tateyamaria sp.]|uniref:hypothetical protein n=1 Tax=uncultured Tateyamaria sp. TaxID=455651 RepID=UPI00261289BD|nr:hypothetical protein [uncultured Tateyamaria sp.]
MSNLSDLLEPFVRPKRDLKAMRPFEEAAYKILEPKVSTDPERGPRKIGSYDLYTDSGQPLEDYLCVILLVQENAGDVFHIAIPRAVYERNWNISATEEYISTNPITARQDTSIFLTKRGFGFGEATRHGLVDFLVFDRNFFDSAYIYQPRTNFYAKFDRYATVLP